MADSTPLLSYSDASTESKHPPSLDEMIEQCIGDFGFSQFFQVILVSFAWVFDAQQTFISVFTDAEPTWHCTPLGSDMCNSAFDICELNKDSWAWDRPIHTSIVSEWGLECASSVIKGLPASSFFIGCLVGGLVLATIADSSLGRKNMLFLSSLMMSISALLTIFSKNIWIYSALKFVNGFGRATIGTCAIVLSTELVGKRWRGQVGVIGFFCFTLGFLSLPAIAYINKGSSWRTLYLWTSIPTIIYCNLVWIFAHESPRWLLLRGRKEEAIKIIKTIAHPRNDGLTMSFLNVIKFEQESRNVNTYSAIKILVEKSWSFRRLSTIMTVTCGIGLVYYGMPLALANLSFNLYLSVIFNALSELPASLIIFFLIDKVKRKDSLLVLTLVSGVSSILCIVLGKVSACLQMGLELISFFGACMSFNIALIYTIELFPTCVRNSAMSMVRQAVVFGGALSPLLVAAATKNEFISYGTFGLVIALFGFFVAWLPETRGKTLCDTMEEEEQRVRLDLIH